MKKITSTAEAGIQDESTDDSSWLSQRKPDEGSSTSRSLPRGRGEAILLVDSDAIMRGALARTLRRLGYRVKEASGALEAQRLVHGGRGIQLLFVDLSAPEGNDLELALWFRAMYPETKVLVTTASLWELNTHVGYDSEFVFLAKPFTAAELARVLRRILS